MPPPFDEIPAAAMVEFERNIARLEGLDVKTMMAGFEELRESNRSLGDKPLAVLVAGRSPADPKSLDSKPTPQTRPVSGPELTAMFPMLSVSIPIMLAIETSNFAVGCLSTSRKRPILSPARAPPAITSGVRSN